MMMLYVVTIGHKYHTPCPSAMSTEGQQHNITTTQSPTSTATADTGAGTASDVVDNDKAKNLIVVPSPASSALVSLSTSPLSRFEMHQYQPSANLSDDENYMDIVMIITRSSQLRQGSMGCILVRPRSNTITTTFEQHERQKIMAPGDEPLPVAEDHTETNNHSKHNEDDHVENGNNELSSTLLNRIIAATTNTSLFTPKDSDVHAEINAIGQVASQRTQTAVASSSTTTTQGATAYITMPPCKKCFGALHAAGVTRIVSRRSHPIILHKVADKVGIQLVTLTQDELDSQKERLAQFFSHCVSDGRRKENGNLEGGNDGMNDVSDEVVVDEEDGDRRIKSARKLTSNEEEDDMNKVPKIDDI